MTLQRAQSSKQRIAAWLLAATVVAVLIGANAHLVYVATTSQPDCVAHLRQDHTEHGQFRAAVSSCSLK